jgi:hypothetical protein
MLRGIKMKMYKYDLKKEMEQIEKENYYDPNLYCEDLKIKDIVEKMFNAYGNQIVIRFHILDDKDVLVAKVNVCFGLCDCCLARDELKKIIKNCKEFTVYDFN